MVSSITQILSVQTYTCIILEKSLLNDIYAQIPNRYLRHTMKLLARTSLLLVLHPSTDTNTPIDACYKHIFNDALRTCAYFHCASFCNGILPC